MQVLRHDKAVAHPLKQKQHLKHVPEYLVPVSMRSVADTSGRRKKRRTGRAQGLSQEQRISKSRSRDPLLAPSQHAEGSATTDVGGGDGAGNLDGEGAGDVDAKEERLYTMKESFKLGRSISGRRQWQERHQKGKFNVKRAKGNQHRTPGSFVKSKPYKG